MIKVVFTILLFVLGVLILLYAAFTICNLVSGDRDFWFCPSRKKADLLYISFGRFYALYTIAPAKWDLDASDCSVKYNGEWLYMESMIDRIRFRLFCKRKEDAKNKEYVNKRTKDLIERWQKDINDYKKVMTGEDKDGEG